MKKKSLISESIVVIILWLSLSTARASIFTVTTTAPTGAGSIDAAVTNANGNGIGKDTIYFAITGAAPFTINLSSALQAINGNLLIDGTSQAGYNPLTPVPVIEFINTAVTTFTVIGGISEIRALAFNATNGHGLVLNSSGNIITGCYFGLALDGITDKGNSFHGIQINSSSNIIGGTSIRERNVIAGNDQMGIQVSGSGNSIIGNYIGTNAAGTSAVPNSQIGVQINAGPNNIIGGSSSGSSNLISGNGQTGIQVNSNSNSIIGNYIGTNAAGTSAVANGQIGIHINSASNNIVGGATPGSSNLISGNLQHGIQILAGSANFVVGNYIGTNAFGTAAIGNGLDGLVIANNSTNNKIGGASPDSSNIISGNVQHGIELNGTASNKVFGNVIGLQADKSSALGNIQHGILIFNNSNFNQIGSTGAATGNIISSNGTPTTSGIGINIINSQGTIVKSNIIGTSANTQLARGNSSHCIQLQSGSTQTVIGGSHTTEGNILSAAIGGAGINLDPTCNKTVIKGNYIGTDNTGTLALGNYVIGIILKSDSCIIGGTNPGEGNIIADTKSICGLLIANSNDNTVKGNYIGVGLNNTPLPNKTNGISISVENTGSTASRNIIQNNTIAYNNNNGINVGGVALSGLTNNINQLDNNLRFNSIFCNKQLGISLNFTTPTSQGNNGKAAPIINNGLSTSSKVVGLANGLQSTDLVDIYEMSDCLNCDLNPQGKKYIATVSPDATGNWSYEQSTPITGTLIAMATDAQGNSSQFSLCFTPCAAKAIVNNQNEFSIMLETNKQETISLVSSSTFSNLTTVPGKTFWSIGTPDTTAPALLSTAGSIDMSFAIGGGVGSYGPGLYNVYLIAKQNGCIDTTKVKFNIFFIPNMITPNGDQKNDQWAVGNEPGQFDAKIYNRWGDLVYSKHDYTNEWDGSGLSDGVYYYLLEDKTQSSRLYKGWVQIIK